MHSILWALAGAEVILNLNTLLRRDIFTKQRRLSSVVCDVLAGVWRPLTEWSRSSVSVWRNSEREPIVVQRTVLRVTWLGRVWSDIWIR
jgi:hypothetical protein